MQLLTTRAASAIIELFSLCEGFILRRKEMTRAFVYQIRSLPETEQTYLLERVAATGDRQAQDDPNWIALLSRQTSFRFFGHNGSFSAQLERHTSQHAEKIGRKPYWSAYRKASGVQAKTYLGHDLTLLALEAAAARLEVRLKQKLGLSDEQTLRMTRPPGGKSAEQEKVTFLLDQNQKKDQVIRDLQQELENRDRVIADLKRELENRDRVIAERKEQQKKQARQRRPHGRKS
jgi:hypothetical protein